MSEKKLIVLDVRTPAEFSETHVEGSLNIDYYAPNFMSELQKLEKNACYKLYCRSGTRSGQATQLMTTLGFSDVENIGTVDSAAEFLKRKKI